MAPSTRVKVSSLRAFDVTVARHERVVHRRGYAAMVDILRVFAELAFR